MYIHDTHILVELDLGASFGCLYTSLSFTGLLQWIFKALEEVNWRQPLRNLLDQCHVEAGDRMAIGVRIFLETALEVGVRRKRCNDPQEAKLACIIAPVGQCQQVPGSIVHEAGVTCRGEPFTFL